MSRDDTTDLEKEVTHLRLALHHAKMQVERLTAVSQHFIIEVKATRDELQATREDLDRANETLAKLFKERA